MRLSHRNAVLVCPWGCGACSCVCPLAIDFYSAALASFTHSLARSLTSFLGSLWSSLVKTAFMWDPSGTANLSYSKHRNLSLHHPPAPKETGVNWRRVKVVLWCFVYQDMTFACSYPITNTIVCVMFKFPSCGCVGSHIWKGPEKMLHSGFNDSFF